MRHASGAGAARKLPNPSLLLPSQVVPGWRAQWPGEGLSREGVVADARNRGLSASTPETCVVTAAKTPARWRLWLGEHSVLASLPLPRVARYVRFSVSTNIVAPEVSLFLSYAPAARARALEWLAQEMGPNAVQSAGPDDAAIASSRHTNDGSVVQDDGRSRKQRFDYIYRCPLCKERLRNDGSCEPCKVQFVGIEQKVADRIDFNLPEASDEGITPPRYRSFWDKDNDGSAIMCFQSRATGWRVWIPCFMNYLDSFETTQTRFPYWFREQRFDARTVQTLADLTDEQFKERAAHMPGRTAEHMRRYDSDAFQREYYWVFMEKNASAHWQTRATRKQIILHRHRRAECAPDCSKRHRPQAR